MEDFVRILDHLPQGHPERSRYEREPIAFALGEDEFKVFELVTKEGITLIPGDRAYIGKEAEKRDAIQHVKRRLGFDELTTAAQNEVPLIVAQIVKEKEERFVRFFNEAQAITTRFHMLELLPGLGKKTMWATLEERKKGPFTSFEDIAKRVPMVHHPEKLIAKRIEQEIANPGEKYHLFAAR